MNKQQKNGVTVMAIAMSLFHLGLLSGFVLSCIAVEQGDWAVMAIFLLVAVPGAFFAHKLRGAAMRLLGTQPPPSE
jgi:hypothetical protein